MDVAMGKEQAQDALKGVFTGEGEALKTLGIIMQDSTLEAYALANGYKKQYDDMSQAEKVALRYAFVMNATKNAQGDFARTSDGSANQMRIFQESLKEIGVTFGNILLPTFTAIISKINELLQMFGNLDPYTQKIIVVVGLITAAIGPLLIAIGMLSTGFSVVAGALATISAPVLIVIGVLAALTAAFIYLWNTNDGFKNSIINAWNQIVKFVVPIFEEIKKVAFLVWNELSQFWKNNSESILTMFKSIWGAISAYYLFIFNIIKTAATSIFDALKLYWSIWGENIVTNFKIAWETIQGVFSGAVKIITGIFKIIEGIFTGNWAKIWEGVKLIFIGAWDAIVASIKGSINFMINAINALINGLNKISFSMPSWIPVLGGKSFSLNIPKIPQLATGTNYIPQDMLAYLHKGEAVVPKEYNDAGNGINITITGNTISSSMDIDRIATQLVKRLRLAGVTA
jgi:hypothetical protein